MATTPAKTVKDRVLREERATPALILFKVDPAFEADPGSLPGVVPFAGVVGVSVGVAAVADGVAAGGMGERVCR